jgi:hypothetical protein
MAILSEDQASEDEKGNPLVLTMPWSKASHRRRREVIAPEGQSQIKFLPIRSDTRSSSLAQSRAQGVVLAHVGEVHRVGEAGGGYLVLPYCWRRSHRRPNGKPQPNGRSKLAAPDDAMLRADLVKLFADHQLAVDDGPISFLIVRSERSFAAARSVVAELDREALRRQRPVTRALASEILGSG